jgi:hypothetical protein
MDFHGLLVILRVLCVVVRVWEVDFGDLRSNGMALINRSS